jgi:SAM-dependent methyltransferase
MTGEETYQLSLLQGSQAKWEHSPGLRAIYASIYQRMRTYATGTHWLELGSGIGVAREFLPGVVTSDLANTGYVDREVDAYAIPCEGWTSIFALDVFHHLRQPQRLLDAAAAALEPGGRLILVEPAATPFGQLFYRICHHEPMRSDWVQPPYEFPLEADGSFANMAMASTMLAGKQGPLEAVCGSSWKRVALSYHDCLAYPLTGGFSRPQLLPTACLKGLLALEQRLPQWLMRRLALRVTVVLERV